MKTYDRILSNSKVKASAKWLQIETIDMHTGGEPLRVIIEGYPALKGQNVLEYRRFAKDNFDHLRTALMFEPRGHADMYGCILVPPNDSEGDFGVVFMHNEGYSTMCGHAVIALTKLAVLMNWIEVREGVNTILIDAPCGRIKSYVYLKNGSITKVGFESVPSFVVSLDNQIQLPDLGALKYDIAYGGAFYAYVNTSLLNLPLVPENYQRIISLGKQIKEAVIAKGRGIDHPFEAELSFLYGTIFIGEPISDGVDSRNVCVFADGEVDRSPTGSGVSGRMAIHHARKEIELGGSMKIESILGSVFTASIKEEVDFGPYKAVVPRVEGMAYITGRHTFLIDPDDPFKDGFILR
jgi:proline racemase